MCLLYGHRANIKPSIEMTRTGCTPRHEHVIVLVRTSLQPQILKRGPSACYEVKDEDPK